MAKVIWYLKEINKKKLVFKNINLSSFYVVFYLISFIWVFPAFSQDYKNEAGATSDNDVYIAFLKDRYYTNGIFIHFRHALKQKDTSANLEKKTIEFEVGQKIFTPYYAKAPDPQLHDRPFTAYLYIGSTINWFYKDEKIIKLTAQIGTIGPNAQGREVQTFYHKVLGIYKVSGWEYQLKNEMGINLSGNYNQLLYRSKSRRTDMMAASSVWVGNTFTGASLGVMFRFGKINPIYRSISYNSLISNNTSSKEKPSKELFLFTKPQINYLAYDATIQGGLFRKDDGPVTFNNKHLVYSQQLGLCFSLARWSANYIVTFKGKEVESSAAPYRYASVILLHRFN